ncbi:hypothetical protein D3C81_1581020 [compost metagenome]
MRIAFTDIRTQQWFIVIHILVRNIDFIVRFECHITCRIGNPDIFLQISELVDIQRFNRMCTAGTTFDNFNEVAAVTSLLIRFIGIDINQENTVVPFQIMNFNGFVDTLIGVQVKTMQVYRTAVFQGDGTDFRIFTIGDPVGVIRQRKVEIAAPFPGCCVKEVCFMPMPV